MAGRRRLAAFGISAAVFALDWLSKAAIRAHVSGLETVRVIPGFFNIVHAENPGIAFSIFADFNGAWRTNALLFFSSAAVVFMGVLIFTGAASGRLVRCGLALVLGGALGNLYDRAAHGTVTDFVEVHAGVHYFPAFNAADSCITIGAALLLIDMWRGRRGDSSEKAGDVS